MSQRSFPYRPAFAVAVSALVVGNAVAADQFCVPHPFSPVCDNPRAPGPGFPHVARTQPPGPMGPITQQLSTVTGPTDPTGPGPRGV